MGNFQKPPIMVLRTGLLKKTRNHGIRRKERRFPIDQILGKAKVLGVKGPLEEGNKSKVPGLYFPHLVPGTLKKKKKTKTVIGLWRKKELIIKGAQN